MTANPVSISSSSRSASSERVATYGSPSSLNAMATTDRKIELVKDHVLTTIRSRMPVPTLFTPKLKINLGVFINDQLLFRKIAEFLASLTEEDRVDQRAIAKRFEASDLLAEITALFHNNPSAYFPYFYAACCDVLNQEPSQKDLKAGIEGRIFTLKNALVAQHEPQLIRNSQAQHQLSVQQLSSIKEEGATFLRECLKIHLHALKADESISFRNLLTSTAEQLIPFVQEITRMYLRENQISCPDNPLTFRDSSGYNRHAFVAATILEVCLNSLGYHTRMMQRSDLEPKVTLATEHSVLEVTGPHSSRYIVDPCFIQFHKDVCLDDGALPKQSVLVLEESEVNKYIEEKLMTHWKSNFQLVLKDHAAAIKKLEERDQLISFVIHRFGLPADMVHASNPEEFARSALKRVWDLSTYCPVLSNAGYEAIFIGAGTAKKTHAYINSMGLSTLAAHHLPVSKVEDRLRTLLLDSNLKGRNSVEALTLLAHLPSNKRNTYASLCDMDPRIQELTGFKLHLNAYFCSLKKVVNLDGKDKSVIYGCSGADCMSVLLATDAHDLTLVDFTKVPYTEFEQALRRLKKWKLGQPLVSEETDLQDLTDNFFGTRTDYGGSRSSLTADGHHYMSNLALKLLFDLAEVGVDINKIVLKAYTGGIGARIEFPWQYYGVHSSRQRCITFVTGDITKPAEYPEFLKAKLNEGIDIFYMKAAFAAPNHYPQFLPHIAKCIRKGGWLMTADKTFTMETKNPEPFLAENNLAFSLQTKDEIRLLENLCKIVPYNPLSEIPLLKIFPPHKRLHRTPGSDATYWSILSLRQKIE